jgi:hypothetical protein
MRLKDKLKSLCLRINTEKQFNARVTIPLFKIFIQDERSLISGSQPFLYNIRERFLFGIFDIFCFDFLLYNASIVQIVFIYNIWLKYSSLPVLLKVALNTRKQTKPLPVIIYVEFAKDL